MVMYGNQLRCQKKFRFAGDHVPSTMPWNTAWYTMPSDLKGHYVFLAFGDLTVAQ